MNRPVLLAVCCFLVGVTGDAATTYVAVTSGPYVEGSPVGGYFVDRYGLVRGMVATKLAGMVVIAVPVVLAHRDRAVVLAAMFGGVGLLSLAAAGYNLLVIVGFI